MQAVFRGALGKHRYTRLLAGTDLSKVIYAYGTTDQAVGRLTGAEVAFLESRGAEVLAVEGGARVDARRPGRRRPDRGAARGPGRGRRRKGGRGTDRAYGFEP